MRKLIPGDIPMMEQYSIRHKFISLLENWQYVTTGERLDIGPRFNLHQLFVESGIRCTIVGGHSLAGFIVEDEVQYTCFILKYAP